MIDHVLESVSIASHPEAVVVLTSDSPSDDPLALYMRQAGWSVWRGPLENVFERFRGGLLAHTCRWMMRISADSPLLDPGLLEAAVRIAERSEDADIVTNVQPRTFPKGQSVEMVRAETFLSVDSTDLDMAEQEHVIPYFYANTSRFRILNMEAAEPYEAEPGYTVDTLEDYRRLSIMTERPCFAIRSEARRVL